jgi:hypothetical protein
MVITATDVQQAFKIQSGSVSLLTDKLDIDYVKYSNQEINIPITVSNISKEFYIKAYPVSSFSGLELFTPESLLPITDSNPIVIMPTSSRELFVRVTEDLNELQEQTRPELIKFFLSAMVKGTSVTSEKLANGAICSGNSECASDFCDNPSNQADGGICKARPTDSSQGNSGGGGGTDNGAGGGNTDTQA